MLVACGAGCGDTCGNQDGNNVPLSRETGYLALDEKKGRKVMAAMDLTAGSFVMEFVGQQCDDDVMHSEKAKGYTSTYALQCAHSPDKRTKNERGKHKAKRGYNINPFKAGNLAGFINHSCKPNAVFVFVSIKMHMFDSNELNYLVFRNMREE